MSKHIIEGYEFEVGEIYALGESVIICMGGYLRYMTQGDTVNPKDLDRFHICHLAKQPPMQKKWVPKDGEIIIHKALDRPHRYHSKGPTNLDEFRPQTPQERGEV